MFDELEKQAHDFVLEKTFFFSFLVLHFFWNNLMIG